MGFGGLGVGRVGGLEARSPPTRFLPVMSRPPLTFQAAKAGWSAAQVFEKDGLAVESMPNGSQYPELN